MNYIQISITATEVEQEILISQLADLGATGFEQVETFLLAYFLEDDFQSYDVNVIIKNFEFQLNTLKDQNWNSLWESKFKPVIVNDFCAIRAHFHQPADDVQHEIIITPKMSFGTGHHATTFMMIQLMRELDFTNKSVFDFGTGTGILTILAKKLGASFITAIDVDEWSITNALENLERNEIEGFNLYQSSELPAEAYDIVLANINRNVLLEHSVRLKEIVKPKGMLLLSGLLKEDEKEICLAFTIQGFQMVKRNEKQNWICLLLAN